MASCELSAQVVYVVSSTVEDEVVGTYIIQSINVLGAAEYTTTSELGGRFIVRYSILDSRTGTHSLSIHTHGRAGGTCSGLPTSFRDTIGIPTCIKVRKSDVLVHM